MPNTKHVIDKIEILTVKIILNINDSIELGTGVILYINNDFYVITVHHTIFGKDGTYSTNLKNLTIEDYNGNVINIENIESLNTLALLKIKNINIELPKLLVLDKAYYDKKYYLRGFPEAIDGGNNSHPFNDVSCDQRTTTSIVLKINNMNDDSSGEDTIENINGLSGSGVFFEQYNKLYIVGCINELLNSSGVFNGVKANTLIDLYKSKLLNIEFDEFKTIEDITVKIKKDRIKITQEEFDNFKEKDNINFNYLNRKHETIFAQIEVFKKNKLRIEQYLNGEIIIDELTVIHSKFKDTWLHLLESMLEYIDLNYSDLIETKYVGQTRIVQLLSYVKESINSEFEFLNNSLLEKLSGYVISKWLLDCNINFVVEEIS